MPPGGWAIVFDGNDEAFRHWLSENPDGFVVNTYRPNGSPNYLVLHRATCGTIWRAEGNDGQWSERDYMKICAATVEDLQRMARRFGRDAGDFSKVCGICNPPHA